MHSFFIHVVTNLMAYMLATKVSASLPFIYGLVHSVLRHVNIVLQNLLIIVLLASLFPRPVHSPVLSTCTVMPTSYSKHRRCIYYIPKLTKTCLLRNSSYIICTLKTTSFLIHNQIGSSPNMANFCQMNKQKLVYESKKLFIQHVHTKN